LRRQSSIVTLFLSCGALHPEGAFVTSQHGPDEATKARLLLVLLALVWGMSWPIMKIALDEIGVFTLRAWGFSLSALSLFTLIYLQRRNVSIPRSAWLHLGIATLFNVVGFALFSSFAQLHADTSRVVIVNYSMPVWSSLMAWMALGERLTTRTTIGLALCIGGLVTLVYPAAAARSAAGLLLALGCALCWAAGTVYMKWSRIPGDLLAITAWQIAIGAVVFVAGLITIQGLPSPSLVSPQVVMAVLYNGLIGTGLAFVLWFAIIERLPTATAALGSLATPVVGVLGSMLLLGEQPTTPDLIGFALIFAAAACVLVPSGARTAAQTS
jgi:drug/metabolite transporter (DMT)-like permease